ncbi:MAG: helix-turn-helix domain-containing protein [Deltaproteobacteria bacterium]|nr:helix-turn-helix domain-containing protein [Deltaproteobacteria bacterium]
MTEPRAQRSPRVIAIASGKGGVGKSLLAANVSVFLATLSKKVVAIDASFGAANLHRLVGVPRPQGRLADSLRKNGVPLAETLESSSVPGLELISGFDSPPWTANPRPQQIATVAEQLRTIDADYVVLDLGSGTGASGLDLAEAADEVVLVATPEPTSVELAYRWMLTAFLRRLMSSEIADQARELIREHFASPLPPPLDLHRVAADESPALADGIAEAIDGFNPGLVVNWARSKADIDLGLALTAAVRRRFGLPVHFLGHLEYDDAVWVSLRHGRPLLIEHPEVRVSKCIEKVTRRLMGRPSAPSFDELASEPSCYAQLEVDPGATEEEIRRSMRRLRTVYSPESVVVAGLYEPVELERLREQLEAAYDTVMDPVKRKQYDQDLFPDGVPVKSALVPTLPAAAPPPEERPPMPKIEASEITGDLLRQAREARGIDLREIAEHTKIGMTYLDAIENETFGKLPAEVYVRGFLTEYAKMIGLDSGQVVDSYLRRLRDATGDLTT